MILSGKPLGITAAEKSLNKIRIKKAEKPQIAKTVTEDLKRHKEDFTMGKIDVSQIEGYESMSMEDKLKALEGFEIPAPDFSGYVKKDLFDKTASELAAHKKQLKEKLTEDEAAKLREQEERAELQEKYEKLLRESEVAKNKAKLVGLGYDDKLADETAEAMADGDLEKVFINQKKHLDTFEKKVRAEALKDTPKPTPDGDSKTMTLDKLRKMSPAERATFYQEHPEEYKELYGGN